MRVVRNVRCLHLHYNAFSEMTRMYAADMMRATFEMKLPEQNKYETANFDMYYDIFRVFMLTMST